MAFDQSGLARKLNTDYILLGHHANLGNRHAKRRQTIMHVSYTYSTRETTTKPYITRLKPTYGLKGTGV